MAPERIRVKSSKTFGEKVATGVVGTVINLILAVFSITCIYPLVWMFYNSLKVKRVFNKNVIALPTDPTIENYIKILTNKDYNIATSMVNSLRTTVISLFFIVLFSFICGYIIARIKFKGNRALYIMLLMGMLIPVHSLLVPVYVVFKNANLIGHWFTLIIPYVAFGIPMGVFLVEGFVKAIPVELEEAAAIDGSSFTRTLFSIILPVVRPILVTLAIIQCFSCWNEFSFALVLVGGARADLQTVPLAMTNFKGQFASDYPKQMAAMLTTMSPIVVLYFIFSKQIIEGMVAGAVKG